MTASTAVEPWSLVWCCFWAMRIILPMITWRLYLNSCSNEAEKDDDSRASRLAATQDDPGYVGPYKYQKLYLLACKNLVGKEGASESAVELTMGSRPEVRKRDKHRSRLDATQRKDRRLARIEKNAQEAQLPEMARNPKYKTSTLHSILTERENMKMRSRSSSSSSRSSLPRMPSLSSHDLQGVGQNLQDERQASSLESFDKGLEQYDPAVVSVNCRPKTGPGVICNTSGVEERVLALLAQPVTELPQTQTALNANAPIFTRTALSSRAQMFVPCFDESESCKSKEQVLTAKTKMAR